MLVASKAPGLGEAGNVLGGMDRGSCQEHAGSKAEIVSSGVSAEVPEDPGSPRGPPGSVSPDVQSR